MGDLDEAAARLEQAFPRPAADDLHDMVRYAYAAEVHAGRLFGHLAEAAPDESDARLWRLLEEVEADTAARLALIARRNGIALPDAARFKTLGALTASCFLGRPPSDYFDWIADAIEPYTDDLRAIEACVTTVADRADAAMIVEHERAIARCCLLLPKGAARASEPLRRHLAAAAASGP